LSFFAPFSEFLMVCVVVFGSFFEPVSVVPVNFGVGSGEVLELESGRRVIIVFFLFCGVRRKSRVSVSLSDEVIEEVERRRGLVKRSTYFESLIRRALELEPEEGACARGKGTRRRTCR